MDSLSLTTAGSVDDGKSTLIGRLLLDSRSLPEDQRPAVSSERGSPLAWLTDGLKFERERGITIDVAYRYFGTSRRRFVIADSPGHFEFTRNMVTAASTCQLAVLLVDARAGMTEQTCRHAFLASLLGLRSLALCVNKMDLVDWQESVYDAICEDFITFASRLELSEVHTFPVSALHGDNITEPSQNTPWYRGPTLLYHLETTHVGAASNLVDGRFPVQSVGRHPSDGQSYCLGRVASGVFRPGDDVVVVPSGFTSRIKAIRNMEAELHRAIAYQSVAVALEDDLEVRRGDMIARVHNRPTVAQDFDATLCWLTASRNLEPQKKYELRHTSRGVAAIVGKVHYKIDVQTLSRRADVESVGVNDICRVSIHTGEPLFFDSYRDNRVTGCFILVDPLTHETVAAGMIR